MLDKEVPNWVAERAKCRVDLIFESLCQIVVRDVKEANKLPVGLRHGRTFTLDMADEGTAPIAQVSRTVNGERETIATFELEGEVVKVVVMDGGVNRAHLEWDEASRKCLLTVGGETFALWRFSQRMLNIGFFGT